MTELDTIRERVTHAAAELLIGILAFEHALADCTTVEAAQIVRESIGGCYAAFDRINAAANARHAHLSIRRDIAAMQVAHD